MDKARKGQSTRKPPAPSDSHDALDAWIRDEVDQSQMRQWIANAGSVPGWT